MASILSLQPPHGLLKLRLSRTSLLAQCISPGLVETRFAFKLHDKDPERAAATYEDIKVGPSSGPSKAPQSLSALCLAYHSWRARVGCGC